MITREKLKELRVFVERINNQWQINEEHDEWVSLEEVCDTLDKLWTVAEAAKNVCKALERTTHFASPDLKAYRECIEAISELEREVV